MMYNDPFYACTPDGVDNGQMKLKVTIDGNQETKSLSRIEETGLFETTNDISSSLDWFLYFPLFEISSGEIGLKAEIISEKSSGQFLTLNPPELVVGISIVHFTTRTNSYIMYLKNFNTSDEPFNAGCFNITDDSLLGSPTSVDNIPGCAVECKNNNKRVSAWKDSSCYCLDAIPYNQIFYSDKCIDFFLSGTDKV